MLTEATRGTEEARLVAAIRRGDEAAFTALVRQHQSLMLRVARGYVRDARVAEEVVQETWMALLEGIDRFEGRASLKTWLFRVLVKRAITRATRERRQVPFSSLAGADDEGGPTVDPDRFLGADHARWPGHWAAPPVDFDAMPEQRLLSRETLQLVQAAIERLPPRQRDVIVMRDIGGFAPEEVCAALDLSEGNQRVLLHRARAKVREELERHLA
ncbi:MAG: sigma-70 family RNA polymerase sigma factor [Actinomycetota bacterium]|nr:sigma-70 family RNA polymerase sigma factor [Actinomycetota bacterium]MDQ5808932.1 sigma-70 family RNA polymerase sigma factor [Actinomycetota bacterium]